ncbi:MAG: bifunctional YncE family protein/alkaline phosphatase family protein [Bryobacteraceae bacterium]
MTALHLFVLNQGYNPPSISVIDVKTEKETSRTPVADAWLGLALSRDGRKLYVGGGSRASVFEFDFADGKLTPARTFEIVPAADRKHTDFIADLAFSPDGRLLYVGDLFHDQILVINPQSGRVIEKLKTGRRPYRILFHPDGKSYFVTSWADGTLYQHEAENGRLINRLQLGPQTTDMILLGGAPPTEEGRKSPYVARMFVAASNTNKVFSVAIDANREPKLLETINVSMTPFQPIGMTPSAVAASADGKRLYVVCSDANAVAVADISEPDSRVAGFVPTGWYPTAARALADGRLFVFNGRGPRSYPNPKGPNPTQKAAPVHAGIQAVEYVGRIQKGSVSILDPFDDAQLGEFTKTVFANSPYDDKLLREIDIPNGNPIPRRPGDPSPIEHVIYIVKENRTYDQVLGDLGKGNGDPSLCLFPEKVSPNHHKLAREFVLLDNFYVNSDVSADGHNWSTSAIAPVYVQKMWPNSYASRRKHYDYEGGEPAALPPAGYIWTNVLSAGLPMRNYGYFAENIPANELKQGGPLVHKIRDSRLIPVTHTGYRAFDLDYLDIDRAKVFLADFKRLEQEGKTPRFVIMRMGNDHTSAIAPGKYAPLAAMADNDQALGMIVEELSKTKAWAKMAIFVLEDDAQNGPDHIDSHRSPAFVISPYTRRGGMVDSTLYNTTSILRTMELILGLRPMTTFDAAATPLWNAFADKPDTAPYTAEKARIDIHERNPQPTAATRQLVARTLAMDFDEADRIDDDEMNDILWKALRGGDPPAPVRSLFGH